MLNTVSYSCDLCTQKRAKYEGPQFRSTLWRLFLSRPEPNRGIAVLSAKECGFRCIRLRWLLLRHQAPLWG